MKTMSTLRSIELLLGSLRQRYWQAQEQNKLEQAQELRQVYLELQEIYNKMPEHRRI